MRKAFLILLSGMFFAVCHPARRTSVNAVRKTDDVTLEKLMDKITTAQEFKTYFAKGTVSYTGSEFDGEADAQLRVIRDSVAVLILRKYGIELFRIMVDRDSVTYMDRINNEWSRKSVLDWTAQYRMPIDFFMLQDIVTTGFYLTDDLFYELEKGKDRYSIKGYSELFSMTSEVAYAPPQPLAMRLMKDGKTLDFTFSDLQKAEGRNAPRSIHATYRDGSDVSPEQINIHWSEISFDKEGQVRFSIPERYTRK